MSDEIMPFIEAAVNSANRIRDELEKSGGGFDYIKGVVEQAQVAIAVWQDRDAPFGVGWLLIKGQQKLREVATGRRIIKAAAITGIPCMSAEQAEALLQIAGERDWLN
jgi:hypothetical protein